MSSSSTITRANETGEGLGRHAAPGEVLADLWLDELGMSAADLAAKIGEDEDFIQRVLDAEDEFTSVLALKISRLFGTQPRFWMNMQTNYDLAISEAKHERELRAIERMEMDAA